jgi:CheY-like chemotaxis protein
MYRVLVVEDNKQLGLAYRVTLKYAGFDFRLATDGEEALAILRDWQPEVILLDLIMPRKGGLATLVDIKKDRLLKHIPVIVASNLGQKEDSDKAMAMGASGFIIKSNTSPDEIVQRITEAIATAETSSAAR